MFLINKYTKMYYAIIENAKYRVTSEYTERHHIIPKSLGGSNSSQNLVALTAREHFIAHRLLTKMTVGSEREKMCLAAHRMSTSTNADYKIKSRAYRTIREEFAAVMSVKMKGNTYSTVNNKRRIKQKFNGLEFDSFKELCDYAKDKYGLSRFVMKEYRKKYPDAKTFEEYVEIRNENNEKSRVAGKLNKGRPSPFSGTPNHLRSS